MRKQMIALLAGAMLMMAAGNASALTIWFGDATKPSDGYFVFDNNVSNPDGVYVPGTSTLLNDSNPLAGGIQYQGAFNGFNFSLTSGFSHPLVGDANTSTLHLTSLAVTYTGIGTRSLDVWLTDTGYTLPYYAAGNPNAVVKSHIGGATAGTVSYQGYIDPTNTGANWGVYGPQSKLIDSGTFTAGAFSNNALVSTYLSGPFALTEGISITQLASGQSTSVDWIIDTTPVPEPGTMVLLGFGMLGLAIYGKRRMNKEA